MCGRGRVGSVSKRWASSPIFSHVVGLLAWSTTLLLIRLADGRRFEQSGCVMTSRRRCCVIIVID